MNSPKYHIFVCTSCRTNGVQKGFCFNKGGVSLVDKFMEEIEDRDLSGDVMVTNAAAVPLPLFIPRVSGTEI